MYPVQELPHHLIEIGEKLKNPPEELNQKIHLLDGVEVLLSSVAQDPSFPVRHALLPTKENIIAEGFFGSSDVSIKISSLLCIHEIIRITVPDLPYEDDRMKEIFEETVKAFEHLSSGSGRSFLRAKRILYLVANVQSGLLLLDLGCESLVAQLFQIFLKDTQSDHPEEVVSDMENLMTRLIMEADELSVEILRPLLRSIGAENQVKSPASARLGTKVLQNCSTTVQPYLHTLIEQLKQDLEHCTHAVSLGCPEDNVRKEASKDGSGTAEQITQGSAEPGTAKPGTSGSGAQMEKKTTEEVQARKRSLPRKLTNDYVLYEAPRRKKEETAADGDAEQSLPKRRRRTKEKNEVREELVGSRIKVWWPADKVYYDGTVSSYDPTRKRHKVVYADGEVESLRLSQEQWSLVDGASTIRDSHQEPNPLNRSSSRVPVDEAEKDEEKQPKEDDASSSTERPHK